MRNSFVARLSVGLFALVAACNVAPPEAEAVPGEVGVMEAAATGPGRWALTAQGQREYVLDSRLCPGTVTNLPPNAQVLPVPELDAFLVIRPEAGGLLAAKVTCNCTSGSGCHPMKAGGQIGCVMGDNCSQCGRANGVVGLEPGTTTQLAPSTQLSVSQNGLSVTRLHTFTSQCPAQPAAVSALNARAVEVNGGQVPPQVGPEGVLPAGYAKVLELVEGQTSQMLFPSGSIPGSQLSVSRALSAVSCSCNSSGTCKRESGMGWERCNADKCSSCTMTDSLTASFEPAF